MHSSKIFIHVLVKAKTVEKCHHTLKILPKPKKVRVHKQMKENEAIAIEVNINYCYKSN